MLTLYHAPMSRSTRIVQLIDELGIGDEVDIRVASIRRHDGSGGADPENPHPEGKVPLLVDDGVAIRESNAIMLYLTDRFPQAGLGIPVGERLRGTYLSWLFWYGNVLEPVVVHEYAGLDHPALKLTFRGMAEVTAALERALSASPYLVGEAFTAADLICASSFLWFPAITPDVPAIRDWVKRCAERPAAARTLEFDRRLMAA